MIYNGDFEIYDTCPPNLSQPGGFDYVRYCIGWYSAMYNTTPDFFNACDPFNAVSVPSNILGFQDAHSGFGYCGFIGFAIDPAYGRNWWEYIQTILQEPMQAGSKYKVSLYFSLGESSFLSNKDIGIYFSSDTVYRAGWDWYPFNYIPHIKATNFITDTTKWIEVSGIYVAKGGEKFLTIGHFGDTVSPDTLRVKPKSPEVICEQAYYYVDDVSVFYCPDCEVNVVYIPNIFSPNNDGQNDLFYIRGQFISEIEYAIYNRWGNEVFRSNDINFGWDGMYKGKLCNPDVFAYYAIIKFNDGTEQIKKGNITLIR